jgi:hypothetical protein
VHTWEHPIPFLGAWGENSASLYQKLNAPPNYRHINIPDQHSLLQQEQPNFNRMLEASYTKKDRVGGEVPVLQLAKKMYRMLLGDASKDATYRNLLYAQREGVENAVAIVAEQVLLSHAMVLLTLPYP